LLEVVDKEFVRTYSKLVMRIHHDDAKRELASLLVICRVIMTREKKSETSPSPIGQRSEDCKEKSIWTALHG
jgi:hypothetical protein